MLKAILARRLRTERLRRKLSQQRLAELSGLHQTYISDIERARRNVTLDVVARLAAAMELAPESLLTDDDESL